MKNKDMSASSTSTQAGHVEKTKTFWRLFGFNNAFMIGVMVMVVLAGGMAFALNAGQASHVAKESIASEFSAATGLDDIQQIQRNLERRIEEMLAPATGGAKIIVKVNVDVDFSPKTLRRELYDPKNFAIRSEQRDEETQRGGADLEKGGKSVAGSVGAREASRASRVAGREINKEEQGVVSGAGDIRRLTVTLVVGGTYVRNAKGVMEFAPRPPEDLRRIRLLVAHAVGFSEARGDSIEVTSMPLGEAEHVASLIEKVLPHLNSLLIFLFLAAVALSLALAFIRRGR
ncbi:MAG: hypothetical protein LBH94_00950 [Deltaproteobacteria bacterium]|nr:hypothetical protein [Deltaproteobacteria bacterium]